MLNLAMGEEATDFQLLGRDVVMVILQTKEDVWDNKEIFKLMNAFFDNSFKTLEFCTALESCLRRTRDSQLMIKLAVKKFEEDEDGGDGRFVWTFAELKKFKAAGDTFTPEFVQLFEPLNKQHLSTLNMLQIEKGKLDKKYNTMKRRKRVMNVIFAIAFISVVTFSIVAAVKSAPPLVIGLAAAQAVPLAPTGKWCNTIWDRYLKNTAQEKQLITSMQLLTFKTIRDLEDIQVLVRILSNQFGLFADLGDREQGDIQLVIDEIKRNLEGFGETIENLSVHGGKCSKIVTKESRAILQKIIRHPDPNPPVS